MKKQIFLTVFVFALIISLSLSCYAEKTTLRVMWWGSQTRHERTQQVIKLFEEKYPDIDVKPEFASWGEYWDKIDVQIAGGNMADIVQHVRKYVTEYVNNDVLLDLTPYVESGELNVKDIPKAIIETERIKGMLAGIPLGVNATGFIYDAELLAKAGIKEIDPNWTWEDYFKICKTIKEKLGIFASDTLAAMETGVGFMVFLRQHGLELYNEDGTGLGYDDDNLYVEFIGMDMKGIEDGFFLPPSIRQEVTGKVESSGVCTQKAALNSNHWSNQLAALSNSAGKQLAITTYPKGKDQVQEGLFIKPSMMWSVNKKTDKVDAVLKFLNFWFNDIEAAKILGTERGIPVSTAVKEALKPTLSGNDKVVFEYLDLAAEHSSPLGPPQPAPHKEIVALFSEVLYKALFKVETLEEAAAEFRAKATELLENQ